jgi:hypothetical protein
MRQEQSPEQSPPTPPIDPYEKALKILDAERERLQQAGEMLRASEIETEEELEEHFDQQSRLYRQICLEMGLAWPPPLLEAEGEDYSEV